MVTPLMALTGQTRIYYINSVLGMLTEGYYLFKKRIALPLYHENYHSASPCHLE